MVTRNKRSNYGDFIILIYINVVNKFIIIILINICDNYMMGVSIILNDKFRNKG